MRKTTTTTNPEIEKLYSFWLNAVMPFEMISVAAVQGLKDRSNLSGTPELGLKNAITHRENVDEYGHLVYEALNKVR